MPDALGAAARPCLAPHPGEAATTESMATARFRVLSDMSAPRGRPIHDGRSAVGAKQAPAVKTPLLLNVTAFPEPPPVAATVNEVL